MSRRGSGLVALALLAGCAAVGPDYRTPGTTTASALPLFPSAGGSGSVATVVVQEPPEQWWQLLHDAVLDAVVAQALSANYDLQAAVANVAAARAQLAQVDRRRLPSVDVAGTVRERREAGAAKRKVSPQDAEPTSALATFGLDALWEIDLFGRVRRSVEAAVADLGSVEAVRNQVLTSLLATVASAYVDLRGAQMRLTVAERNVSVQQQTLDLVLALNTEGAATDLDGARARAQLLASQATIPVFRAAATAAINRLTTLTAQAPGALNAQLAAAQPLPQLPDLIAVGAPADLLRRRADIQAAERAIAAASARIGVATADLFPTVSLVATAGVSASPLSNLIAPGAPFYSFGPTLRWNIFDRAAIYARIAQADSAAAAAVARYQATVTQALEEVDTALSALRNEQERQIQLVAAAAASRDAAQLAQLRYHEGAEDFLTVLDAERSLLLLEDQVAVSTINVTQRLVDIHRALGGGWQSAALPVDQSYTPAASR